MTKLLLYGLLIYFLYKIIFEVVVPVRKGVRTVRQNIEQMQEAAKAAEAARRSTNTTQQQASAQTVKQNTTPVEVEYIDFEEVKKK
jgi:Sec-independent protein translocase protein TatA